MRTRHGSKLAAAVTTIAVALSACSGAERPTQGEAVTAPVTTVGPTTTTLPASPIVPADLWAVVGTAGLLAPAADGTAPFPSLVVGVPSGTAGATDVTALVVRTRMLQQVAFEARVVPGLVRRAVLSVHGTDADAAAWLATRAFRIDPAEGPTPVASSIPGALAFVHRPVGATVSTVEVVVARGPMSVSVEVRQRIAEPAVEPAALAEADTAMNKIVAGIDNRLASCTKPCTGTGGPVPVSAHRALAVGECANRTAPGPDFVPAALDTLPTPCTLAHAFHAPVAVPIPADPRIYETVTIATPPDHPAVVLAAACRTAAVQWMTAAAYSPGANGAFSLHVQLPERAAFDAGARTAACVLSPADTSSPAAALNPLPG